MRSRGNRNSGWFCKSSVSPIKFLSYTFSFRQEVYQLATNGFLHADRWKIRKVGAQPWSRSVSFNRSVRTSTSCFKNLFRNVITFWFLSSFILALLANITVSCRHTIQICCTNPQPSAIHLEVPQMCHSLRNTVYFNGHCILLIFLPLHQYHCLLYTRYRPCRWASACPFHMNIELFISKYIQTWYVCRNFATLQQMNLNCVYLSHAHSSK